MNETLLCYKSLKNGTKCIDQSQLYILAISNAVLAVPTAAANALVIVTILTTSSLRTPSYLLLTSLAFSDLVVGLCTQSVLSAMIFEILLKRETLVYLVAIVTFGAASTSCVSVLTLTAISVDRYLAIRLKMRYRSVVTAQRVRYFIVMTWTIAVLITCYIMIAREMGQILRILAVVSISTCLIVIVISYTMSFRDLKIHCAQTQPQGNQQQQSNSTTQSNAIDVLKYRKLLKTMLLLVMVILICYLPMLGVVTLFVLQPGPDQFVISWGLMSIVCLNSTLNPVIYLTRMKDIRHACIQKLRKLFRWKD